MKQELKAVSVIRQDGWFPNLFFMGVYKFFFFFLNLFSFQKL